MSEQARFGEVWHCRLCGEERIEGRDAYFEHCRKRHGEVIQATGKILATKTLRAHLDGEDVTTNLYDVALPDGKELASVCETLERAEAFSARAWLGKEGER